MRHNRSYPSKEVDVHIQDQNSPIVEAFMVIYVRTLILANPTVIDSYDVSVTDASLVTVGNVATLQNKQRGFQGKALSKVGNVLTLDSPLDYVFPIEGTAIREGKTSLNVNGATTPVTVIFKPTVGVAIRLNGDKNEQLELIIQDDLSGLFAFTALCRGHVLED